MYEGELRKNGVGGIFKIVEAIKSFSKKENSIGSVVSGQTNKKTYYCIL